MPLLLFATPHESRAFRQALAHAQNSPFAPFAARDATVIHTGIGAEAVRKKIFQLIDATPSLVISAGFAGGLDPDLATGDLLLGENHSSPEFARRIPDSFRRVQLHTSENAIETAAEKARLFSTGAGQAVDMETALLAAHFRGQNIPFLALRIVSDSAREDLPVPFHISWDPVRQHPRPIRLAAWLATHPGRVVPFIRFVRRLPSLQSRLASGLLLALERTAD